jgi:hypothetical protein
MRGGKKAVRPEVDRGDADDLRAPGRANPIPPLASFLARKHERHHDRGRRKREATGLLELGDGAGDLADHHCGRRKREATGKCEGRKSLAETHPEAVAMAKRLAAVRKRKPSLRTIAAALAAAGHFNERGKPFGPKSIAVMLAT